MTKMADVWCIDEFVSKGNSRSMNQNQLKQVLIESMEHEMEHELAFKKRERVTKFIRSTKQSEAIGHNYMIMRSLHIAAENGEETKNIN